MKQLISCIIILICFIHCTSEKQNKSFDPKQFIPEGLDGGNKYIKNKGNNYWSLRNIDTSLKIDSLTYLYLPENAFVNENGDIVEQYYLLITKFDVKSDFILANLQTVSGTILLESNGMFHIIAKDLQGNNLKIAKNKRIGMECFYRSANQNMNLYIGNLTKGSIDWLNPVAPDNYLINIPLPKDNFFLGVAINGIGYIKPPIDTTGNSEKLLNSYFATREFLTRRINKSFSDSFADLKIYYENIGKNLYEADSLCIIYEKEHRYKWKDRFAYSFEESQKSGLPFIDVSEQRKNYEERLTKPKIINTFGIDLDNGIARQKLRKKGLSEIQIDEAYLIHYRRKQIVKSMQEEKNFSDFFTINKFGWYNFDKIVDLKDGIIADVSVNVEGGNPTSPIKIYYILSDKKSVIYGKQLRDNLYTVDYSTNENAKIPKSSIVTVIAVSFQERDALVGSVVLHLKKKNKLKLEKIYLTEVDSWVKNSLSH